MRAALLFFEIITPYSTIFFAASRGSLFAPTLEPSPLISSPFLSEEKIFFSGITSYVDSSGILFVSAKVMPFCSGGATCVIFFTSCFPSNQTLQAFTPKKNIMLKSSRMTIHTLGTIKNHRFV